MQITPSKLRLTISPGVFFFFSLMVLLIPLRWLLAWVSSVVIHESFHILALYCLDKRYDSIHVGINGVRIHTTPMSLCEELVCAIAGPFGGLLLMLTGKWMPILALCSGFQSLYNLLPVYPQDGGRALRCAAYLLFPDRWAQMICDVTEYVCLIVVGAIGFYGTFVLRVGIIPILIAALLIQRCHKMKNTLQTA